MKVRSIVAVALVVVGCNSKPSSSDTPPPMPTDIASAIASAMAMTAPSAASLEGDVRDQFGKKFSCPNDRITIATRDAGIDDIAGKPATPPDEVQKDPERLKKWNDDRARDLAERSASAATHFLFEVSGCGHTLLENCRAHHANGAVYPNAADCNDVAPPK
jgi:hypothetical protein